MAQLKYHFGGKLAVHFSNEQLKIIKFNSDAMRFIYNKQVYYDRYLADMRNYYGNSRYYNDPMLIEWRQTIQKRYRLLTHIKQTFSGLWLNDKQLDSLAAANAIQHHRKAWANHRSDKHRWGLPTWHRQKDHPYQLLYQTSNVMHKNISNIRFVDKHHIKIPKLGLVKVVRIPARLKRNWSNLRIGTVTITVQPNGSQYLSLAVASDIPFVKPLPKTNSQIGIDMNEGKLTVDSNSDYYDNPKYAKQSQAKLSQLQKALSRKQRHCIKLSHRQHRKLALFKHYQQLRLKVAKLHQHVENQRNTYLHLISKRIIENQDIVAIEKLSSTQMLNHNNKHNQRILDAGWSILATDLQYKATLYDKSVVLVNPAYTTQTCHVCQFRKVGDDKITRFGNQKHHTSHSEFYCYNPNCPLYQQLQDRDVNAAQNILLRGLAQQ